jgi:hypothetical protein
MLDSGQPHKLRARKVRNGYETLPNFKKKVAKLCRFGSGK